MSDQHQSEPRSEHRWRMDRRRFLGSVLGSVVALILQACGKEVDPSPRPSPHSYPDPSSSPYPPPPPTPSATSTVPPTATTDGEVHLPMIGESPSTETPTPSPTETPEPSPTATATPRPVATPFPPGPPTKLGVFLGHHSSKLSDLLRTGKLPFVKTIELDPNLVAHIKEMSPDTTVVARYSPLSQINWATADPTHEARRFVQRLLPVATERRRRENIDAWEAFNEPVVKEREAMKRLADFEAERTRLLAAEGIRSCIGNFATGEPPLELWPDFFPAVQAVKEHNGYLGLHEYSAPYMWFGSGPYQLESGADEGDEGWLTLRYRKVYRQYLQPNNLEVPLVITETGIDGLVKDRPGPQDGKGWRDFINFWYQEGRIRTTAAGFYMEQLAWYDAELAQDDYVVGASIFVLSATEGWDSFEIGGKVVGLLKQYVSVHPR